jgi:branched-subunit amino acid aminotransferase/4-amino-4-deoxychorismate lyase
MVLYVNNNGTIFSNDAPTIHAGNRGHLYGDGVFESIRIMAGKPINIQNHVARMIKGANVLKINTPTYYTAAFFEEKILELIEKSGIKEGGRCRMSIDRATGGAYLPESNDAIFYIEVYPYDVSHFELNAKGLEVDIYRDIKLYKNFLSNYKTKTGLPYIMASISANEQGLDDLFLTNDKGNILESGSFNIFIVSNGVLYTPGLEEGCIAGTMRMQIINLAVKNNIKIYECSILPQNLLSADEVFFTNAIRGINWVGAYRTKRYQNNMSRRLVVLLNAFWENELGI